MQMYIRGSHRYYESDGTQHVCKAPFLLLLQPADKSGPENTYAVVRKVALRQIGHFMMGRVRLGPKWHSVSGSYGNDGLPMTVDVLPKDAKLLPRALYDAWNKGEGWNSAGNEAAAMREWATREFAV